MSRICLHRGKTCIWLHTSTLVMASYMTLSGHVDLMCTAYASILLHEGAHAAAAACLGHQPDEIELTHMGAMLYLHDQARIPAVRRIAVLLAGPAMTLLLCWLSVSMTQHGWLPSGVGRLLFISNAGVLLVNLLPCLPLDGGNLVSLLLGCFLPLRTCCAVMRIIGSICGVSLLGMAFAAAWHGWGMNLSLVISGCFLIHAAQRSTATAAMNELRSLMDRKTRLEQKGIAPASTLAVMADVPVLQLMRMLPSGRYITCIVLERGAMRKIGEIGEEQIISAALDQPSVSAGELIAAASGSEHKNTPTLVAKT